MCLDDNVISKRSSMEFESKLPNVGTTIFTVMSALAREHDAINLSQGFPNFDCSPKLHNLVQEYMAKGHNQYAPMAGVPALREALAGKMKNLYSADVDANSEITITAGATQAIFTIISTFVKAGDEVILLEPAYDSYKPSIELMGATPVIYELTAPDYKVDWDKMQSLCSKRTRMIIVNTPHNPTGTILQASDMEALQALTKDTNILVLSDEVYEHLIYDGEAHQSVLRFPELFQRSLITYSFGKTFHSTGWKIGYCVAPEHLMKEFRKVHQFNVFSVNTPMQYAIADFMTNPDEYLSLNNFFQEKRDFFLETMKGSRFRPIPCKGTYFQLFDYSEISDERDTDFAKRITREFGVASIPVSVFYSNGLDEKVIRLCFAKTNDLLARAGEVLRTI